MNLALFDLDNALLAGDSDYEWAQFLIDRGILERETYEAENLRFYEQYKSGTLDIYEFLDFQLAPLACHTSEQLARWHEEFMRERILPIVLDKGRALVAAHKSSGDLCAIITATNSFVTAPIAREFGIDHLLATEPEFRGGRYTGKPAGVPCFQHGKVTRLNAWLADRRTPLESFEQSSFYSDSRNDLPLLEAVTHPVAVDPDPTLAEIAHSRKWPVMSLR